MATATINTSKGGRELLVLTLGPREVGKLTSALVVHYDADLTSITDAVINSDYKFDWYTSKLEKDEE